MEIYRNKSPSSAFKNDNFKGSFDNVLFGQVCFSFFLLIYYIEILLMKFTQNLYPTNVKYHIIAIQSSVLAYCVSPKLLVKLLLSS